MNMGHVGNEGRPNSNALGRDLQLAGGRIQWQALSSSKMTSTLVLAPLGLAVAMGERSATTMEFGLSSRGYPVVRIGVAQVRRSKSDL